MTTAYLTLIDDLPLADILRFATAHGDPMHNTAPTVPNMPAVEPRPTVPASPKGKRAGTYSVVAPRAATKGGAR